MQKNTVNFQLQKKSSAQQIKGKKVRKLWKYLLEVMLEHNSTKVNAIMTEKQKRNIQFHLNTAGLFQKINNKLT